MFRHVVYTGSMGKKSPFALTAPGSASQFLCCSTSLAYHQRQAFSCPPETLSRSPRMIALNSQTWVRPQSCLSQLKETLQRYNLNALPRLGTQSLATTHCKETLHYFPCWGVLHSGLAEESRICTTHHILHGRVCVSSSLSPLMSIMLASPSKLGSQVHSLPNTCIHVLWHAASVEEECDKVQWELCS